MTAAAAAVTSPGRRYGLPWRGQRYALASLALLDGPVANGQG